MVANATKLITCRRCQRIRPHHAHGLCTGCYSSERRMPPEGADDTLVNFDRVDRLALAWMMFCRGDKDEAVAVACGVGLDVVREYRKEMPKWWEREHRINRISPLGSTEGRVMKTEAAKAAQRTRRVALARFLLRRGPLEFKAIIEELGVNHNSLANDLRCEWFERTIPGYRLSPWRVTDAGRVALKGMRKVEDAA